ncbi:hypothetical protein ACSSV1_003634 [Labrenzia sp. MBR-25]
MNDFSALTHMGNFAAIAPHPEGLCDHIAVSCSHRYSECGHKDD